MKDEVLRTSSFLFCIEKVVNSDYATGSKNFACFATFA